MTPVGFWHVRCVAFLTAAFVRALGHRAVVLTQQPLQVVEVGDPSPALDREVKVPRCAAAGVPEVWIIDLQGDAVEVYREPSATDYAHARRLERDAEVAPAAFPDAVVAVDALLG